MKIRTFQYDLVRILAIIVGLVGLTVVIGWVYNIAILESLLPNMVTMKFSTAISFVMSGILLYLINESKNKNSELARILLLGPIIVILFYMITLLVSNFTGTYTGIENLFIREKSDAIGSVLPGVPSIATVINFLLVASVSILSLIRYEKHGKEIPIIGGIICTVSVTALLGYVANIPLLYYLINGFSSAMAIHTAITFLLIGIVLIIYSKIKYSESSKENKFISIRIKILTILFCGISPAIFLISLFRISSTQNISYAIPEIATLLSFAVIASLFISKFISTPITKLQNVAQEIGKGNFDIKIEIKEGDEISDLQKSFNLMSESLRKSTILLSHTEQKYKNLYENSPILFRTIDLGGIILDCNKSYAEQLGYTKEEIIGKSIFEHISEQSIDTLKESFEQWKTRGVVYNKEIWLKRKDGTVFPTLLGATNLFDDNGKLIGSNTAIRDITEIYETRKKLEESEHEIREQLSQLEKLSLIKDDFLRMITHELKTPLVPIKGYIDILISEKIGPINEEQKKKLEIISSSTRSLLRLISDLLDAQKIELGRLKLDKDVHDLAEIVTNTVNKMKPDADRYGITITTDLGNPIALLCDNIRIEQVLSNLIANSLDFCPKQNGRINIKLSSENKHARIIVKDNGIGIVKESINKIFVKFYQVDTSTTREHGGTGIGLSVCKGIVEGHGGKIWAESDGRDTGAEIHILLPGVK